MSLYGKFLLYVLVGRNTVLEYIALSPVFCTDYVIELQAPQTQL